MVKPALRDDEDNDSRDLAIAALRAWAYNRRGFVNEDEPTDPEHILAYAHVDIAIGRGCTRRTVQSDRGGIRYALMKGSTTLALIAQLSAGWGTFAPDQRDGESPAFGEYPTRPEAEAGAVVQTIGKRGSNAT